MLDEGDGDDVIVHGPSRKAFCLSILNWLPKAAVGEQAMEFFICENCWEYSLPPVALRRFYSLLWSTFGDQLKQPRRPGRLAAVCEVHYPIRSKYSIGIDAVQALDRNTNTTLPMPRTNEDFLASFTGTHSRWELLGNLYIVLGCTAVYLARNDALYHDLIPAGMDNRGFASTMLDCATACLRICEEFGRPANLLSLMLTYKCNWFTSVVKGDTRSDAPSLPTIHLLT